MHCREVRWAPVKTRGWQAQPSDKQPMPSAQAKQRRQEKRVVQGSPTKGGSRGDLGDDIARFNEDQQNLNQRRRDLQARIAERDTKSSMENIQRPTPQLGHQMSERRGSEADSAAAHSKEG